MSLLVKKRPPPKAFTPALLLRMASPQSVTFTEFPSLYSAPPFPPNPTSFCPLLMTEHLLASSLLAPLPVAVLLLTKLL